MYPCWGSNPPIGACVWVFLQCEYSNTLDFWKNIDGSALLLRVSTWYRCVRRFCRGIQSYLSNCRRLCMNCLEGFFPLSGLSYIVLGLNLSIQLCCPCRVIGGWMLLPFLKELLKGYCYWLVLLLREISQGLFLLAFLYCHLFMMKVSLGGIPLSPTRFLLAAVFPLFFSK